MTYRYISWLKKWYNPPKMEALMPPFHHRSNLLNFFMLSDLFIFVSTIAWMEFSQVIFTENGTGNEVNILYQISPLSLFTHNCDSYYTYIWILLFNISTIIALSIVVLCIYAVHQTSFEPSCILFLILTIIIFIAVSTFPIIAFISFFKLSVFVVSSFVHSNMNIIPAIYSKNVFFPLHENLSSPHSDPFYQKVFKFIHIHQPPNNCAFDWNIIVTLFKASLIPIFAFFDCELQSSQEEIKAITHQPNNKYYETNDDEYQLRIGIANKVLAEYYSSSFWIPLNSKYVAQKLLKTSYSECTTKFIRELRGYTMTNIISSIRQSFKWEFKMIWCTNASDDNNNNMSLYDKLLEMQYVVLLFAFIPLQTVFILYGLLYPYIIAYQIMTDLYGYHSMQNYVVENQVIKFIFISTLSSSRSIWRSLYLLLNYWYFNLFSIFLILHFILICLIMYKLWNLRRVFEMCLNVMIVPDNSILNEELVHQMMQLRVNIQATKVRDSQLAKLFGRYHLDKMIIQYTGNMHECKEHLP